MIHSFFSLLTPLVFSFFVSFLIAFPITVTAAPSTHGAHPTRHQQLLHLTSFTAEGKIAFQQGKHGGNANFQWKQLGNHYEISIVGALGAGSLKIANHDQSVTLVSSKGDNYTAKTPEELLKKALGWTVPLTPMQYWLRGVPDPNHPIKSALAKDGNCLFVLEQEGWKITYQSYLQVGQFQLPQKILLQHGNIRLRLVFKHWTL